MSPMGGLNALGLLAGGLGLFLLGMAMMTDGLKLAAGPALHSILRNATKTRWHALGSRVLVTAMVQSSSASMTIALTAAQGGLIDTQGAAAVVIGANVGTTVTALLAAIGATSNARRAATAHVAFNLVTATVALLLLPWLIDALGRAREALDLPPDPATKLALFHTTFNVLGVLLMWPIADRLTAWLQQRFRAREDDEAQPRHLDKNVLAVPTLALDALEREIARVGEFALRTLRGVLAGVAPAALVREQAVVQQLDAAIETFVEGINRQAMSQAASERLAVLLRIERYHESSSEAALVAAPLPQPATADAALQAAHDHFVGRCGALLAHGEAAATAAAAGAITEPDADGATMEAAYQALKAAPLSAGAAGRLPLAAMEDALRRYSALRRATQQAVKARRRSLQDTMS